MAHSRSNSSCPSLRQQPAAVNARAVKEDVVRTEPAHEYLKVKNSTSSPVSTPISKKGSDLQDSSTSDDALPKEDVAIAIKSSSSVYDILSPRARWLVLLATSLAALLVPFTGKSDGILQDVSDHVTGPTGRSNMCPRWVPHRGMPGLAAQSMQKKLGEHFDANSHQGFTSSACR